MSSSSEHTNSSLREEAGFSSKSSLSHTWLYDTRNDRAVASGGVHLRSFQVSQMKHTCLRSRRVLTSCHDGHDKELAGLGGDAAFVKSQLAVQALRRVTSGSVGISAGKHLA